MMIEETAPSSKPQENAAPVIDLLLYLAVGMGLFLVIGLAIGSLLIEVSLLATTLAYLVNIVVFIGTVYLVGVRRGRLSWEEIGFLPPRLPGFWIRVAVLAALALIPIRVLLALVTQLLVGGSLESLADTPRMDLLVPEGPLLLTFVISFVLGGILVPVAEELYFRGAIFTWFRRRYSLWVAVIGSTLLFALGHADLLAVVVTSAVIGVVNALLFERSRSIWVPITVHVVNNSLAFLSLYVLLWIQQTIGLPAGL
jgi:membrane protease YdiL (CAAX protease family)